MFRCITEITIKQMSNNRSKTLSFDFVNQFNSSDTWVDLTNQATVKFPKNIYARDENNKLYPLVGTTQNLGGFSNTDPLFLKGDTITINFGYYYYDKLGNEFRELAYRPIFEGYITEVISKMPVELHCEDNMWKLKQLPATNKTYSATTTWEAMLKDMLQGTGFTVNALTSTTIGELRVENETVAQVIQRVRNDYHLEAYFRGTELRCGSKVYIDTEAVTNVFAFQQNIISDDLTYKRKDDIILSAICYSVNKFELTTQTKTGKTKTKSERLEILIYWDKKQQKFLYREKPYPENVEGERRTLYVSNATNAADLYQKCVPLLKRYFYTGFRGKFVTFGMPYVKQGDNVIIKDPILPERNGKYKVKGVNYSGGINGHRQEIILDYLIAFYKDGQYTSVPPDVLNA